MTDQLLDPQDAAAPEVPPAPEPDAPAETATAPQSVKADPTLYVLLALDPTGLWKVVGQSITARSAEVAVRGYAEKAPQTATENGLTLVAVPERSWKPVTIKTKVTTSLVIEDAVPS